jgi:hypothetical protein
VRGDQWAVAARPGVVFFIMKINGTRVPKAIPKSQKQST